ncbi:MAG: hypothetical protein ACK4GE_01985 [Caldimicrobium sp.]
MSIQDSSQEEIILCARCAWREFCTKKFSMDNTKPFRCPDFSLDIVLLSKGKRGDQKKDPGKDKEDS